MRAFLNLERETRLELATPTLARLCSTNWAIPAYWAVFIKTYTKKWSGKRDSNSRPQPWQGCALPTELFPRIEQFLLKLTLKKIWSGKRDSNSRPQPWQGCALPTELFPRIEQFLLKLTLKNGAGNETRTRDPNLGKVVLYQLSYSRIALYDTASKFRVNSFMKKLSLIA